MVRELGATILIAVSVGAFAVPFVLGSAMLSIFGRESKSADFPEQERPPTYFMNAASENSVMEESIDKNQDGRSDQWTVVIRDETPFVGVYVLSDRNFDGQPGDVSVSVGTGSEQGTCSLIDEDGDAQFDRRQVTFLPSGVTTDQVRYIDLDLDGTLDLKEVVRGSKQNGGIQLAERYVLVDDQFVQASTDSSVKDRHCWINDGGGNLAELVFEAGVWRPVESKKQ